MYVPILLWYVPIGVALAIMHRHIVLLQYTMKLETFYIECDGAGD